LIAASGAVLFAFGATWWRFSTDANSYVIAVLFLLLAVRFAVGEHQRLLAAAVAHTAAMLFHELAVFAYVLSTAACTALIYFAAYQYSDHAAYPNLLSWVMSRSAASQTTQGWKQFPAGYLLSYGKLFVGGKLSLIRDFFSIAEAAAFAVCAACIAFAIYLFRHPESESANVADA